MNETCYTLTELYMGCIASGIIMLVFCIAFFGIAFGLWTWGNKQEE